LETEVRGYWSVRGLNVRKTKVFLNIGDRSPGILGCERFECPESRQVGMPEYKMTEARGNWKILG
jgi:hypothetical protein